MSAEGWYKLPASGTLYFGPIPPGVDPADPPEVAAVVGSPAKSAKREVWEDYALGLAKDSTEEEQILGMTRGELIDRYSGEQLVDAGQDDGTVATHEPDLDLASEPEQVDAAPVDGDVGEQHTDGNADIFGHGS